MTVVAVALAGAIGAAGGFLLESRTGQAGAKAWDPRAVGVSLALGLLGGLIVFNIAGADDSAVTASALFAGYLGGSIVPLGLELIESAQPVDSERLVHTAGSVALGCLGLACGLALAAAI